MTETPPTVRTPPPTLGQHTDEVLSMDLRYYARRLEELHRAGAI